MLVPRLMGTAGALTRLLPNTGGCSAGIRRLYLGVVRSMALYGAPVWSPALTARKAALLLRAQRTLAVRVIRGYRTISQDVACALAGSLPWDFEAEILATTYRRRTQSSTREQTPGPSVVDRWRRAARGLAYAKWRERLLEELGRISATRQRTLEALVPVLEAWSDRRHVHFINFFFVSTYVNLNKTKNKADHILCLCRGSLGFTNEASK
ncbi:uncharacterized protein LOC134199432 [Bombyx mori]|uniref:uncharacterized protein LOC134199432 n=1 Tax=Bombyx mori TaxID=7091 RepID=UPI002ED632C0